MADSGYYDSDLTGEELDEAFRNLANLEAGIAQARTAAEEAAKSAQDAHTAALQAEGFLTVFGSVSPDDSGDLDPSRLMTTPVAQESWTVKSRGDRIQSVQVNGFAGQDGSPIPVYLTGHQTVTASLPIVEELGAGDNVQSNVSSGCDIKMVFDGSADENWRLSGQTKKGVLRAFIPAAGAVSGSQLSNWLPQGTTVEWDKVQVANFISISASGNINISIVSEQTSVEDLRSILAANPLIVWYRSTAYTGQDDLSVSLETHAKGNVYAHDPVDLVAVPYTAEDSGQTVGTYVVSSQDGTTVMVSLKAMQDGGDAATLGGKTAAQLTSGFVTAAQLLERIYPVGSIYMSANNVSPQTFLGGTWTQIQGKFLLAASDAYPAGSTGGEATVSLTGAQNGPHQHSGITVDGTPLSWSFPAVTPGSGTAGTLTTQGEQMPLAESSGRGEPHNNMPPYLAVYVWQRMA